MQIVSKKRHKKGARAICGTTSSPSEGGSRLAAKMLPLLLLQVYDDVRKKAMKG